MHVLYLKRTNLLTPLSLPIAPIMLSTNHQSNYLIGMFTIRGSNSDVIPCSNQTVLLCKDDSSN